MIDGFRHDIREQKKYRCTTCGKHESMHDIGVGQKERHLCCYCYIAEGNLPADWHSMCMRAYKERKVNHDTWI